MIGSTRPAVAPETGAPFFLPDAVTVTTRDTTRPLRPTSNTAGSCEGVVGGPVVTLKLVIAPVLGSEVTSAFAGNAIVAPVIDMSTSSRPLPLVTDKRIDPVWVVSVVI